MTAADVDDGPTDVQPSLELKLSARRTRPLVEWTDGAGSFSMELEGRTLVGSSSGVAIRIADRAVSRVHAELEPRADGVWIRDLGSRNGTWIDGMLVERARLPEGARVRLGASTMVVRALEEPSQVPLWPTERFGNLIGRSEIMRELFVRLSRYAAADAPVLVQGETGTGKELAAQALHDASPRGTGPFVIVDCGALPESLLESELFGHARGAFTGAVAPRAGAFETAHGGTVFLDEVGELPLSMQPKLLRVLESQSVRRLGESEYRKIDVRFVAATHRDLHAMVGRGAFREDLYFRLAVLPAYLPPLRERSEDVPLLLEHFLSRAPGVHIPDALLAEIAAHPWLGNVRELRSFAERVIAVGIDAAWQMMKGIDVSSRLPPPPRPSAVTAGALPPVPTDMPFKELREQWIDHLEREYIGAFVRKGMNAPAIAEVAGLDRTYVLRLMRKHNL